MEQKEVLVKVEHLSKKFCKDLKTSLWYGVKDLYSNVLGNKNERSLRPDEFWAVKDINFELRRGECLGLIGHNGAGKSTLLKILNGLINPDEGKVTIKGRVCALIELGAGFNPILTGRENIYNNGAVLGFTKNEIDTKVEEIIDFSEIREFIDMPVQNYSSGMKVRLGFAVAAQMEPDVLIIDEVLAVGDASFRAKCFNRMSELSAKAVLIFVTHSMPLAGRICTRGLLMEKGVVKIDNNINDVIYEYMVNQPAGIQGITGAFELENFKVELEKSEINYLDDLIVNLSFKMHTEIKKFFIHYTVLDQEQKAIYQSFSIVEDDVMVNTNQVMNCLLCIKKIDLTNGKYFMNIGFVENDIRGKNICRYDSVAEFIVKGGKFNSFASILKRTTWELKLLD
jgi:lipopolysaccharide transport system ATP-binding protein